MATKSKTTAVAKLKTASLPANYTETQEADINAFKSRLAVSESNKIQVTQDKYFKLPSKDGDSTKIKTISGIIIDFSSRKAYYEHGFDRDNPTPPGCFAVGFAAHDNLMPSDNSPEKQSDTCRNCAQNKFEQLPNGKWKAKNCKDSYRLALLAPDDDGEGKIMTLDISATATREFDKYVRSLASNHSAPYNVITEFSFDPKSEYPSVRCINIGDVPKTAIGFVLAQRDNATQLIAKEPSTEGFEEKVMAKRLPAPKPRKKAA